MDALLEPFRSGIGLRALAEVVLVGAACGALSFWVVADRLSYGAESLAHGLLPGLVAAAVIGFPLLLGAGLGVVLASLLVAVAGRDTRIGADTATGVVVTGMLGLGAIVALAPDAPARLEELLFGDLLSVGTGDLVAAAVLLAGIGLALAATHRPLAVAIFDPVVAPALGVPPVLARLALLALLAAALTVATLGLGNLLVLAVLVAPAVAVRRHASSPPRAMAAGAAVAVVGGVIGVEASYLVDAAAGACVALALCGLAVLGAVAPTRAPRAASPAAR